MASMWHLNTAQTKNFGVVGKGDKNLQNRMILGRADTKCESWSGRKRLENVTQLKGKIDTKKVDLKFLHLLAKK